MKKVIFKNKFNENSERYLKLEKKMPRVDKEGSV